MLCSSVLCHSTWDFHPSQAHHLESHKYCNLPKVLHKILSFYYYSESIVITPTPKFVNSCIQLIIQAENHLQLIFTLVIQFSETSSPLSGRTQFSIGNKFMYTQLLLKSMLKRPLFFAMIGNCVVVLLFLSISQ